MAAYAPSLIYQITESTEVPAADRYEYWRQSKACNAASGARSRIVSKALAAPVG